MKLKKDKAYEITIEVGFGAGGEKPQGNIHLKGIIRKTENGELIIAPQGAILYGDRMYDPDKPTKK